MNFAITYWALWIIDGINGFAEALVKSNVRVSVAHLISVISVPSIMDNKLCNIVGTRRVDRGSSWIEKVIIWNVHE